MSEIRIAFLLLLMDEMRFKFQRFWKSACFLALFLFLPACSDSPAPPAVAQLPQEPADSWFRGHADASAHGKVIHVAETGNDNAVGTRNAPYRTIARALRQAAPGDTIELAPGTYREAVTIEKGGTEGAPLVIRGSISEDGRKLSVITTAAALDPAAWSAAPDLGSGIYRYNQPLGFKTALISVDGKQIAPVHELTGGGGISSRTLTARELLAWPDDHRIDSPYLEEGLPFWETMGAIAYLPDDPGKADGQTIYLRLFGGSSPAEHTIEAFPVGSAITIDNAGQIAIRDCQISGGDSGVVITGEGAQFNEIRNCDVFLGTDRIQLIGQSSNNVIRDCRLQMRFLGAQTGAWGGGAQMPTPEARKDAALKRFVYNYYKGWASSHNTSADRSIMMEDTRNNLLWNCELDGGLIGISLHNAADILIQNNRVLRHSSVGSSVRDNATRIFYDRNHFEDNSINFRIHRLNEDSGRVVWLTNNTSILPENLGNHVYCHVTPEKEAISLDATPQVAIIHNAFLGGDRGIRLPRATHAGEGLPGFIILNNFFSVGGAAISGVSDFMRQDAVVGAFDYNLIVQDPERIVPHAPWFGKNNFIAQDTSFIPEAADLRQDFRIGGRTFEPIPELYRTVPASAKPKVGALSPPVK